MSDFKDRENLPGDEPNNPDEDIPEVNPDDPDFEFYKNMMGGLHLTPGMPAGFKIVPDGNGGYTNSPMSPEEQRMFMDLLTGNVSRFTGSPNLSNNSKTPSFEPIKYPHYYFLNREYVIQFVNATMTEGSDVNVYAEVIRNPRVTQFHHSIIDAYETLQDNQFLTFLLSLRFDLYLWNYDGISMNIIQNQNPMHPDEKIVIVARCSKERPDWLNHMNSLDFVKRDIVGVVTPFREKDIQVYQVVSMSKHIYEPAVRAEGTFTFSSTSSVTFIDENLDMYAVYNKLIMPMITDAIENFYPSIKVSSVWSRKTCKSIHLAYETRIADHLLTVIFYMSPAYIVDANRNVFGYIPLGEGMFGITNDLIDTIEEPEVNQGTDVIMMLNHMHSTQDSQTLFISLMGMGNIDIFNNTYGVQLGHSLFFLFHKFPTDTMGEYWANDDENGHSWAYMCSLYPSKKDYIMRYAVPNDKVLIPVNPDKTGNDDHFTHVYGFVEIDIPLAAKNGLTTFFDIIKDIKDELIEYLHMTPDKIVKPESNKTFAMSECWCAGSVIRFALTSRRPLKEFIDPKYVSEVETRIKQIRGDESNPQKTPEKRSFFRK